MLFEILSEMSDEQKPISWNLACEKYIWTKDTFSPHASQKVHNILME